MKAFEILQAGKARIEKGWCQGTMALDARNQDVDPDDPEACQWCMAGAVDASLTDAPGELVKQVYAALAAPLQAAGQYSIALFNDTPGRKRYEVLNVFDQAIELAKAES